jgi:hypothetical protein
MSPGAGEPTAAERRAARNEALWREVNDRIDEVDERMRVIAHDSLLSFHCECGREDCHTMIAMTGAEYRDVRRQPDTFAVAAGHEQEMIEHVVRRSPGYLVVDKLAVVETAVGGDGVPRSGG